MKRSLGEDADGSGSKRGDSSSKSSKRHQAAGSQAAKPQKAPTHPEAVLDDDVSRNAGWRQHGVKRAGLHRRAQLMHNARIHDGTDCHAWARMHRMDSVWVQGPDAAAAKEVFDSRPIEGIVAVVTQHLHEDEGVISVKWRVPYLESQVQVRQHPACHGSQGVRKCACCHAAWQASAFHCSCLQPSYDSHFQGRMPILTSQAPSCRLDIACITHRGPHPQSDPTFD